MVAFPFPPAQATMPFDEVKKRESSSLDEKEKVDAVAVSTREVDTAAELTAGAEGQLDPAEALRIRYASSC